MMVVVGKTLYKMESLYIHGESYGDSTQLLYLRARYYNPADGRFISRDTWDGDVNRPTSMNRWGYVEGNPINRTDPTGMCYTNPNPLSSGYWERFWEAPMLGPCSSGTSQAIIPPTSTVEPTEVKPTTCPPTAIPTLTPNLDPWKTDPNYNPSTNSIPSWGSDNSEAGRLLRSEKVYDWLGKSGGYWGGGAPNEKTLVAWLIFMEGSSLERYDQKNMGKGMRYRFNKWGFDAKQRGAFTAFINPHRDDFFNETDWKFLTAPDFNISFYEGMANEIYSGAVENNDGYYLYWFDANEMRKVGVTEADLKRLGIYQKTSRVDGLPFYFTGVPDVFQCGTQGGEDCNQ